MRAWLLIVIALAGCTPGAERVCARKMRLSEDRFGKMDPVSHKKGFAHCVELANAERASNPKRYRCRASCVLDARHLDDAMECDKGCP